MEKMGFLLKELVAIINFISYWEKIFFLSSMNLKLDTPDIASNYLIIDCP